MLYLENVNVRNNQRAQDQMQERIEIEIDYSEFLAASLQRNQFLRQERMRYAFSIFNKNGNGTIS